LNYYYITGCLYEKLQAASFYQRKPISQLIREGGEKNFTDILVAYINQSHPSHLKEKKLFQRILKKEFKSVLSSQIF